MRLFLRMLRTDFANGFWQTRKALLVGLLLFGLLLLAFYFRIGEMAMGNEETVVQTIDRYGPFSIGDILAYFCKGLRKWVIADDGPFPFPAAWMMVVALALYLSLWYPYRDLNGFGTQVLLKGGSRWSWWLSKCVWVAIWSCIPCALALIVACVWAISSGSLCDFSLADGLCWVLGQERSLQTESNGSPIPFFLSVPVVLISMGLLQFALSLLLHSLLSFTVCFSVLFLSAFFANPYLPGNYLMSLRTSVLMTGGTDPFLGVCVAAIVCALCVLVGGLFFSRMDIIDKEFDS